MTGVVDVITGLSAENSRIVRQLTAKLNEHLDAFSSKYVHKSLDPLLKARWPEDEQEEETLWKPVQAAIAAGPQSTKEIDELKTSMLAESRTSDQEVRFEKFSELEHALFAVDLILSDALKNADDIRGELKLAALKSIFNSSLVVFQVGTMFAPALAQRNRFRWGGIQFLDFDKFAKELDPKSIEAFANVIESLCYSIALRVGDSLGTKKLSGVFRELAKSSKDIGFTDIVLFSCVLNAKGLGWSDTLKQLIEKVGKEAYYLSSMLDALMQNLARDVSRVKDRDATKRLVATIQAKRSFRTMAPGAKVVTKMLEHLERNDQFTLTDSKAVPGQAEEASETPEAG